MTPEFFEAYLPYSIAFGALEVWGERFQTMFDQPLVDPNYRRTWYSGRVMHYGVLAQHELLVLQQRADGQLAAQQELGLRWRRVFWCR